VLPHLGFVSMFVVHCRYAAKAVVECGVLK